MHTSWTRSSSSSRRFSSRRICFALCIWAKSSSQYFWALIWCFSQASFSSALIRARSASRCSFSKWTWLWVRRLRSTIGIGIWALSIGRFSKHTIILDLLLSLSHDLLHELVTGQMLFLPFLSPFCPELLCVSNCDGKWFPYSVCSTRRNLIPFHPRLYTAWKSLPRVPFQFVSARGDDPGTLAFLVWVTLA